MLKKYTKNLFEKEVASPKNDYIDLDLTPPRLPSNFAEQIINHSFAEPSVQPQKQNSSIKDPEHPETVIGEHVSLKGELSFQEVLRIDGYFEGELVSEGKLIVGPTGTIKANIDLKEAFISGKVEGNITVKERLVLRGRAEVQGNITAGILSVDEGVSINGHVEVTGSLIHEGEQQNTNP